MESAAAQAIDIYGRDGDDIPQLWRHKKRSVWGLAILAWEGQQKRRYQFQDGTARTFKKPFFSLLEAVDKPLDVTEKVVAELTSKLDLTLARREVLEHAEHTGRHVMTVDDQWRIFMHLYPEGFQDPAFVSEHRHGEDDGKRRRSHLDPAIAEAHATFSDERLTKLMAARDSDEIFADIVSLLRRTPLASGARHVGSLDQLPESQYPELAEALHGVLWGEGSLSTRYSAWIAALTVGESAPSWELVTALPALVQPEQHVCVKASAFRTQARWLAPKLKLAAPRGSTYERVLTMSLQAMDRLRERGGAPRDLLDLNAFIWTTLRPKAKEILEQLKREG